MAGRPQWHSVFLTIPFVLVTIALAIPMAYNRPPSLGELPEAILFFGLFVLAQAIMLRLEVRRHSLTVTVGEIPILLALFYLSATLLAQ